MVLSEAGIGGAYTGASGATSAAGASTSGSGGNWLSALSSGGFSASNNLAMATIGWFGARKQNQFNKKEAQKDRDFQAKQAQLAREYDTQMSNTAAQRRVDDLRKAGLNPMLAYMNQASTPNSPMPSGAQARGENEGAAAVQAYSSAAAVRAVEAGTRKTNAEAALLEAEVPYSGVNARARSDILADELNKIQVEINELDQKVRGARLTNDQMEVMNPLLVQAQKAINNGLKLGLSRKELESSVSDMLHIPFEYAGEAIEKLNRFGETLGGSAADVKEWFENIPEMWREWRRKRGR